VSPLAPFAVLLAALPAASAPPADAPDLRALFVEAVRLHQARDLDAAADAYQRFLAAQPRNVEALSNLGAVRAAQGRYEEAIERYREALAVEPRTAVRFNLAVALQKAGRTTEAVPELERVIAEQPEHRGAVVLLAECRARLGEYGRAAALLTPLYERNPDDRAVTYLLGLSLVQDKQVDKGKPLLDRVLREGESAETRLLMGAVKLGGGDYADASADLRRAVELNPALPLAHVLLGRALMNVGDTTGAAEEFRRELAVNPNDFDAHLLLGVLLKQDDRLQEAGEHFQKAAALRPGDAAAAYQVGALALQRGALEEARAALERVVAVSPDFLEAHVSLALLYYRLNRD
jgi:protein O-GlcNAc transferase